MNTLRRLFILLGLTLLAAAVAAAPHVAPRTHDVDPVVALSAFAPSRDRIEVHWTVADGHYLVKRNLDVQIRQGFEPTSALSVTAAHMRRNPNGDGSTVFYHSVIATQVGVAAARANQLLVQVQYQECGDNEHCSPIRSRVLQVQLPPAVPTHLSLLQLPAKNTLAIGLNNLPASVDASTLPLSAEQAFSFSAIVDDGNHLLMRFTPQPGYYIYRDRISFAIEGASGISPGLPVWPAGRMHQDEHFGNVVVYFDQAEVRLPLVRQRTEATDITLVTTLQGCQNNGICYPPMTRRVRLALPAGTLASLDQATAAPLVITSPHDDQNRTTKGADVGHTEPASNQAKVPQSEQSIPSANTQAGALLPSLANALLLALVGGIILNFLPCVLPVLSLKVLRLAQHGNDRKRARQQANSYTAGILSSFCLIGGLAIGLRAAGQAVGWGFQLQQPHFVGFLAYLLFAVGLSLSGLFTIDGGWSKMGDELASRRGLWGDFFSGALTCVVASPCIAPFMGSALVFAFTAPPIQAFLVFILLGVGLALPFLLISYHPALAKRLPRPGQWMETLKQLLAFPMYLGAIWLLHVLGSQRGTAAMTWVLAGMTLFALGVWLFEKSRWQSQRGGMIFAALVALLGLSPLWSLSNQWDNNATSDSSKGRNNSDALVYSQQLLERLRADNRVVFVNMTAAWCVTCSINERTVLQTQAFINALRDVDGVYLKGDWTNPDPNIEAFIQSQHAVGVPLYVVFGPGSPPTVLPTLLSHAVVEDALRRAAR